MWFFFFYKPEEQKDKILFIDARNSFVQVDRAHRKFSDEQIKNLGIITRLYDGDTKAFDDLIAEYKEKAVGEDKEYFEAQINWLLDKFPNHKYQDVIGLCKVAEIGEVFNDDGELIEIKEDSIADQDWSLNAGRYVGVVIEDDGMSEEEYNNSRDELMPTVDELKTYNLASESIIP